MCWRGSTSATEKCAGVGSVDFYSNPGGYAYNRFCIIGPEALPGDSGSGAYHKQANGNARAAGIVTLGGEGTGVACGVQISDATSSMLNASIIVG